MGTRLSVSLEDPEVSPRTDRPPTFDPLYGFPKGRKPREMKATWEEMDHWKLEFGDRDYCAHLLINLKKCQRQYAPFSHYYCTDDYHGWQNCEYEDHILRMKEFERERRLLKRASRKRAAQEKLSSF
uniref:NADH dehydrogenase [ubiquinone] 1 beta subcomplex subunit 7 n=1 Tax=Wuchereria bancrofti TaxID=6293 RepID=A0A1I8ETT0_WUCBA